jgi:hypothetical protein
MHWVIPPANFLHDEFFDILASQSWLVFDLCLMENSHAFICTRIIVHLNRLKIATPSLPRASATQNSLHYKLIEIGDDGMQ